MSEGPRRHHYQFAHRLLPATAFRMGSDLVAAGRQGRLALDDAWNELGLTLPEGERVRPDGLDASYQRVDPYDVLVVTFPPAMGPAEAHYAAIAVPDDSTRNVRYLVLELGLSPIDGQRYTVMAEWTADGSHVNYGPGPEALPASFIAELTHRLK
jgi:hypothetical protein